MRGEGITSPSGEMWLMGVVLWEIRAQNGQFYKIALSYKICMGDKQNS